MPLDFFLLNVVVKWLTLMVCIWEDLGSNLGMETGYSEGLRLNSILNQQQGESKSFSS
jgi:hypothetical protein